MDVTFLTSSDSNIGPKAEKAVADALRGITTPHPTLVDEINRAGRAGISLGDLKEALQKAWMPQNTVKGMRLHRYVAHFPAHFDVAGAAAVGKAFNKARVYPRAPVQPSPPPARSTVVPSAAAMAAMAAEADAETGPTTATRHSPAVDVRPPTTRHNRGARDVVREAWPRRERHLERDELVGGGRAQRRLL